MSPGTESGATRMDTSYSNNSEEVSKAEDANGTEQKTLPGTDKTSSLREVFKKKKSMKISNVQQVACKERRRIKAQTAQSPRRPTLL